MGLEPTTFELEVQRANPLRHGGFAHRLPPILRLYQFGFYNPLWYVGVVNLSPVSAFILTLRHNSKIVILKI